MSRAPPASDDPSINTDRREIRARNEAAHIDVTGPRTIKAVRRWLQTIDGSPFFLFLHLWDVHYDYIPPARYVELFDPGYRGEISGRELSNDIPLSPNMPARDLEHLIALYDGEIRFTDDTLMKIFDLLGQRERFAETLIIITADHGEEFFDHGGTAHTRTLFDEMIRVPLIIRWPGKIDAGIEIDDQVRLIDLMATILALVGAPAPADSQGRDISPLLRGKKLPPESALAELLVDGRGLRALRSNREKLISSKGDLAHYDLVTDPLEKNPQTPKRGAGIEMQQQLNAVVERSHVLGSLLGKEDDMESSIDPKLCRRLRALGYLGAGADCK
jgi:arylsulfatase A-like enzyme